MYLSPHTQQNRMDAALAMKSYHVPRTYTFHVRPQAAARRPYVLRAGCLERLADLDACMAQVDEALTALRAASGEAAMDTDSEGEQTARGRGKRRK